MTMVALRYDLRVPPFSSATHADLYRACLDQCAWGDEKGLDLVALSEHHGIDDGYLPAPLTLAAAVAGRTKRIQINIAAILVPLHDPVRLAEQMAVLDLVSGGRVGYVCGLGYRHEEFEMAGVDRSQRGRLLEESIEVMRKAWTGEPFEWRGRTVRVTPRPSSQPLLLIGGSTATAARRAARLRAGFFPAVGDPKLAEIYEAECGKLGFTGFAMLPGGPGFVHVSDDPERDWQRIAPHALYEAQTYSSWQTPGQRSQVHVDAKEIEQLRQSGVYRVVTPDECVALAKEFGRIVLHPMMGGISPDLGWESLERFAAKVLPRLKAEG
jgi:alkanesulfonate monooxygenase SsuD/methylene tetrahydromethanopterin reductase-like flavin-dependent oxidoreductase (luciferase family)